MVTDDERDYMYASTPATRGCARTSASAGGSRPSSTTTDGVAELLHALLLSLPGARSSTTATRS